MGEQMFLSEKWLSSQLEVKGQLSAGFRLTDHSSQFSQNYIML